MPSRRADCSRKSRKSRWTRKTSITIDQSQILHLYRKLLKELSLVKSIIIWYRIISIRSYKQPTNSPIARWRSVYGCIMIFSEQSIIRTKSFWSCWISLLRSTIDHDILINILRPSVARVIHQRSLPEGSDWMHGAEVPITPLWCSSGLSAEPLTVHPLLRPSGECSQITWTWLHDVCRRLTTLYNCESG